VPSREISVTRLLSLFFLAVLFSLLSGRFLLVCGLYVPLCSGVWTDD